MAYRFGADEPVGEAFARTAQEQLLTAETALTRELEVDPVEAIHTARKSIKKQRSLLRLVRGSLDPGPRRHEDVALRDAARRLAGARDAAVMTATLDALAERYVGQLPHGAFTALRERLEEGAGEGGPSSSEVSGAASELAAARARLDSLTLDDRGWDALEPGLRRGYRRGRNALAQARKAPTAENLHEWRKRVKDLWYHLRLLTPACGPAVRGQAKDAHALADLLGDDHDLAVLGETLVGVAGGVAVDVHAVLGLIDHRRGLLQTQAVALGERVYAERSKAFVRRVRTSWRAGRRQREAEGRDPADLADVTRAPAGR
jgi:CHAD domain-containing protein